MLIYFRKSVLEDGYNLLSMDGSEVGKISIADIEDIMVKFELEDEIDALDLLCSQSRDTLVGEFNKGCQNASSRI